MSDRRAFAPLWLLLPAASLRFTKSSPVLTCTKTQTSICKSYLNNNVKNYRQFFVHLRKPCISVMFCFVMLCYIMLGWVIYLFRCIMYLFHSLTHLVHLTNLTYLFICSLFCLFICTYFDLIIYYLTWMRFFVVLVTHTKPHDTRQLFHLENSCRPWLKLPKCFNMCHFLATLAFDIVFSEYW